MAHIKQIQITYFLPYSLNVVLLFCENIDQFQSVGEIYINGKTIYGKHSAC